MLQLHDHLADTQHGKLPLISTESLGCASKWSPDGWSTGRRRKAPTSAVGEFRPVTAPSPVRPAYASALGQTAFGRLEANQLTLTPGYSRLRSEISKNSGHDSTRSKLAC